MTDASTIRLMYDAEGEARQLCPWCAGGNSGELSFTIREVSAGLVYNCYRDSCRAVNPSAGFADASLHPRQQQQKRQDRAARLNPYRGATRDLSPAEAAYLMRTFNLSAVTLMASGIRWGIDDQRYILPVCDPSGVFRGVVARQFYAKALGPGEPKALTYKARGGAWCHWTPKRLGSLAGSLVIVEDYISALRVQQLRTRAVALLGTHCSAAIEAELAHAKADRVVIALDNDATQKAYEMAWQLRSSLKHVTVAVLERDLKDLPTDIAVREVLGL